MRVLFANTTARSADSQQHRSLVDTNSANATVRAANSWQRCALASLANAFSCTAVSWGRCLLALLAAAHSANITAHDAANSANSANAFSTTKFVADFNGSTNKEQHCYAADTDSTNAAARSADSRRCLLLASSANAFSCASALWQHYLVALSAKAFACAVAACQRLLLCERCAQAAVLLISQMCKSNLALLSPQSLAGAPDVEAAAAKP